MKYESFEQLVNDECVLEKLNSAATPEEAAAMVAEYGFDLNKELSAIPEGELDEAQLDEVAGGALTWKAVTTAWSVGAQAGVVIRNLWDMKQGRPLSYPKWKFQW